MNVKMLIRRMIMNEDFQLGAGNAVLLLDGFLVKTKIFEYEIFNKDGFWKFTQTLTLPVVKIFSSNSMCS